MTYPTLTTNASEGFYTIFTYVNNVTYGLFSKMVLFALFVIIAMSTFFSSKRTGGKEDFPASCAVAGFVTSGASILMLSIDGLVSVTTVIITIVITLASVLWLMMSKSSN